MTVRLTAGATTGEVGRPALDGSRTRPGARTVVTVTGLAVAACVLGLVLTGGGPHATPPGLPDAGVLTGWGLRLVSVFSTLAAVGTIGSLLVAGMPVRSEAGVGLGGTARSAMTAAGRWSGVWALLATGELVLTASDIAGVAVTRLGGETVLQVASTRPGTALCLVAVAAVAVGLGAQGADTVVGARALLGLALAGLLPGVVVGHASGSAGQDVLVSALVVHVVAVSLWAGGLLGLVLHLRSSPDLAGAVERFSPLALVAYFALAGSGLIAVDERLGLSDESWSSGYGALVAAKAAVLLLLGLAGSRHRRTTITRLAQHADRRPFLRLAGAELLLMGLAIGLASALARSPAPARAMAPPGHGQGHSTLPAVVEPLSLTELATAWRPDAVVLVLLGLAAAGYAHGVRVLQRAGQTWPRSRSLAFAAAILVALVALCSGVATYAPAVLSVQVSQLLVVLIVVPFLMLLGAPASLVGKVARARDASPARRVLAVFSAAASPVTGAVAACAVLLVVYRTPLVELSLRSSWVHLAVLALALASGLLLLAPALEPTVARPGRAAEWWWCMVGVAGCLAVLAAQLTRGDRLLAAGWFLELRWSWVDPVLDQRLAGGVVASAAVLTLVLAVLLRSRPRS